jgi:hypothetical protein
MHVNHFQIPRWGTASIHWTGSGSELKTFKAWVARVIPQDHYGWYPKVGDKTKAGRAFDRTHLSGWFDLSAWVYMCYHWTNSNAPAIDQIWYERHPNYDHKKADPFSLKTPILSYDLGALSMALSDLETSPRKRRTPEVKEAILFMHKKLKELREKLETQRLNKK